MFCIDISLFNRVVNFFFLVNLYLFIHCILYHSIKDIFNSSNSNTIRRHGLPGKPSLYISFNLKIGKILSRVNENFTWGKYIIKLSYKNVLVKQYKSADVGIFIFARIISISFKPFWFTKTFDHTRYLKNILYWARRQIS